MNNPILWLLGGLLGAIVLLAVLMQLGVVEPIFGAKIYSNTSEGIEFEYPKQYELTERAIDSAHTAVTLIHKDNLPVPQNGEGPVAITVDVYRYLGSMGAENWVRTSSNSNFQLSPDDELAVAERDGAEVVSYKWDGLYQGESVVFAHGDSIVMFSVTYQTPTDPIRIDFANLLATVKLTVPGEEK